MNRNRIVTGAADVVAAAGLAFGAASLASADGNSTSTPSPSSTGQSDSSQRQQGAPNGNTDPSKPMRSDEQLLTGDTLARVTAAVEAKEPDATIERVETDSDGVYEAHMVRTDGTHITVQVDKDFAVTNVQEGGPNGSGGPGGRGDHGGPHGDDSEETPSSTDSTEAN